MPSNEQSPHAGEQENSLELNKETLQDLDLEVIDGQAVKGGANIAQSAGMLTPAKVGITSNTSNISLKPAASL